MINLETYIRKVLKSVHPDTSISGAALSEINSVINFIGQDISEKCVRLTESDRKKKGRTMIPRKTISDREVELAIGMVLPGELKRMASGEGRKAISYYNSSMNSDVDSSNPQTSASRAGLIFAPTKTKVGGFFNLYRKIISKRASIYLAAVLEYLTAEILEVAGNYARDDKRNRINIRNLFLAMAGDNDLKHLMTKYNLVIAGGGVEPEILKQLVPRKDEKSRKAYKRAKKRREAAEEGSSEGVISRTPYRFLPGTVALRQIRRYQRQYECMYFPRQTFKKLVREMVDKKMKESRLSVAAVNALQYYIEDYIIDLLRDANHLAIFAGRLRLQAKDVDFIFSLRHES